MDLWFIFTRDNYHINSVGEMSVLDVQTGELIHRSQLDTDHNEDEGQEEQTNLNEMLRDG